MVGKMLQMLCLGAFAAIGVQALDKQLDGLDYDLRQGPDWDPNKCKNDETIAKELKLLSNVTKNVRTYSLADCDVAPVLKHAKELGVKVWLGVWVSGDDTVFQNECKAAQKLIDAKLFDDNVIGVNVGSEAVYRQDITADKAVEYLKSFKELLTKANLKTPVSITDISDIMVYYPQMIEASDIVTVNQFPFWEGVEASKAAAQFLKRIQPLLKLAGDKEVVITETGWPSAGVANTSSVASPEASARFLNDFVLMAEENKLKYYYFQFGDSPWKAKLPGAEKTVEGNFGLFTVDGTMKPEIADLKISKQTDEEDDDGSAATSGENNEAGNAPAHAATKSITIEFTT